MAASAARAARRPRRERRRRIARRVLRGVAGVPRGAGRAAPARPALRGSPLGATPRCSSSSSGSSTGRPACRSSSSAPAGRSSTTCGPAGAAASGTRPPSRCLRCRTTTPRGSSRRCSTSAVLPAETQAASARARGRQPALRRGVRAALPRARIGRGPAAVPRRCRASSPRGSTRCRPSRKSLLQDACRHRQGVLGGRCSRRSARPMAPTRSATASTSSSAGSSFGRCAASSVEGQTGVRVLARARPGRCVRADPPRRRGRPSTAQRPTGSRRWPAIGSPTTPSSSRPPLDRGDLARAGGRRSARPRARRPGRACARARRRSLGQPRPRAGRAPLHACARPGSRRLDRAWPRSREGGSVGRGAGEGELAQQQLEEATVLLEEGGTSAPRERLLGTRQVYFGLGERSASKGSGARCGAARVAAPRARARGGVRRMAIVPVYQGRSPREGPCWPRRRSISESLSGSYRARRIAHVARISPLRAR